ncbi:MAG: phosphoribosylformylglycinamidine synthase subunit PurL [Alphaproteobacteria bacterium]|nr:phosphoribosylformylglycinamidine synthase subunit PurL [Alphaproteobacteria bacterium]
MIVRVEVTSRAGQRDARSADLVRSAATMGIALDQVEVTDLYFLRGDALDGQGVAGVVDTLLVDPVLQHARWMPAADATLPPTAQGARTVEVSPLPGVTDSEAESLLHVAHRLGWPALTHAATGTRYTLRGDLDDDTLQRLARSVMANEVVQAWAIDGLLPPPFVDAEEAEGIVEAVPVRDADDDALLAISAERRLSLDLPEMQAVRAHFQDLGRDPTDLELEMLAQTWSEHCVHKTFKAAITYTEGDAAPVLIDSMYRTFIKAATRASHSDWLRSVFVDNAGIVGFDERFDLAFKVETHNHPSALEPFGGANTGVGGVVRDILGVSARPIATTDVLCFGPPDMGFAELPEGCLHPRRVAAGVIAGVGDYGNKMGIPTVSGAVLYDPGYTANPLVFCGCLGILPRGSHRTAPQPGDLVVVLGGRTGRDGLRGATFSSMEMDTTTAQIAGTAVQIGHPIHEKQALEVVLAARDEGLYTAITDCGAGGLSSAVGEMASTLGAEVQLADVPLKYPGLQPWEIWLSEAQERMVLAVPPAHIDRLNALAEAHATEVTVLGHFTGNGRLLVRHGERVVGDLDVGFLHDGLPQRRLTAVWSPPDLPAAPVLPRSDPGADLLALLATGDIRSKEDVVRSYDHEVQGGTVVKPFVGVADHGPGDAVVLSPLDAAMADPDATRGVALSVGVNPHYGRLDPYRMAQAAVDEAVRNLVAVGADPDQVALLDNFCWGNPRLPDRLGALVRCAKGCHDAAVALGAPYISGKDSLNNEYTGADGEKHAIPGTILISALAIVEDVDATVTMDLTEGALFLVGDTDDELGGSAWLRLHGVEGGRPPAPPADQRARFQALHAAIRSGLVSACHDLSEGGLAVAIAEMCLAGRRGAELDLGAVALRGDTPLGPRTRLFSESLTRFLVGVPHDRIEAFTEAMQGHPVTRVGQAADHGRLVVRDADGHAIIDLGVAAIEAAWRGHVQA